MNSMLPINICQCCRGTGKVKDKNIWIICSECGGEGRTGKLEEDCPYCAGTGKKFTIFFNEPSKEIL